jgi:hypothetical protein
MLFVESAYVSMLAWAGDEDTAEGEEADCGDSVWWAME